MSTTKDAPGASVQPVVSRRLSLTCQCDLCKRGQRYYQNTESLPPEEKEWMRGFYDAVLNAEAEEEMQKAFAASGASKSSDGSKRLSAGAPARGKTGAANSVLSQTNSVRSI